jgi:hypothetical protein
MKSPSFLRFGLLGQLLVIAGIFFLSFMTFNILFRATGGGGYFQEIIAALIGTILAAVVTAMLLTSQTRGEELKERNVEVFRRKFEVFDEFLGLALDHLDDGQLDEREIRSLRRNIYRMSLFSSDDTVQAASSFLRSMVLQEDELELSGLVAAFRTELALSAIDQNFDIDLDLVDRYLQADGDMGVAATTSSIAGLRPALLQDLAVQSPESEGEFEADEPMGVGNGLLFTLTAPHSISFMVGLDYPSEDDPAPAASIIIDASELATAKAKALLREARRYDFIQEDANEPYAEREIPPEELRDIPRIGAPRWVVKPVVEAILELDAFLKGSRRKG